MPILQNFHILDQADLKASDSLKNKRKSFQAGFGYLWWSQPQKVQYVSLHYQSTILSSKDWGQSSLPWLLIHHGLSYKALKFSN